VSARPISANEEALRNAALAVSRAVGEGVFRELVKAMAASLGADIAFIALPKEARCRRMQMLAFYADGQIVEDFEYDVEGTPCETVIGQQFRVYPSGLQQLFPADTEFRNMEAQSYAGCPLTDARGRPVGLMSVVLRREMDQPVLVESVLKIFAARAEAELEHRRAERAIREREAQHRATFDASVDGMVVMDAQARIVDANPAFLAMFGRTREELLAMPPQELVAAESHRTCSDVLAAAAEGRIFQGECKARRADGALFDVELRGVPMHYLGRPHRLVIVRDITERRRAEEQLRQSEERYRLLFEMESDAIVLVDVETLQHLDVNRAAAELYGYSREELLALKSTDLSAEDHKTRTAMQTGSKFVRVPLRYHRKKDGTVFPVEITANFFELHGRRTMLAAIRDVTERKQAEEARGRLEAQLRQAQKMEAIGQLSGGIAHDFNNILTGILGYLMLAGERQDDLGDARLGRYLEQARKASLRARDLIQQMLTFSRSGKGVSRPVEIAELIEESVSLLKSSLPSTVELATQAQAGLAAVMIDPVQVEQVLLNLCINARDAMKGTGSIGVRVQSSRVSGGVCASCQKRFDGLFVELSVQDSGAGIAPEVMERMFEPFFTTKEAGRGSGMGLAMVHGIVHEHVGHIQVNSGPSGTTFRIFLPPLVDEAGVAGAGQGGASLRPGKARPKLSGHVLVVDDEQVVGNFMSELLQGWGLEVSVQRSGFEAAAWLDSRGPELDVVVTDQTMPKMTGLDLARRISGKFPALPVLLYTGYAENLDERQLARAGVRTLLRKPVEPDLLFAALRDALAARRIAAP
jgi:PAS domain S-box-containing protein